MVAVNIRPVVQVTIDDPCLDGRIAEGGHHYGRNWEAYYDGSDPAAEPWECAGCDYISSMRALLPRMVINWSDMELDNWAIVQGEGYWRETRPAITKPRCKFLHYGRSLAGQYGTICSNNDYRPGLYFRLLRYAPVDGETLSPAVAIDLFGAMGESSYALVLPWGDQTADALSYYGDTYTTLIVPKVYRYSEEEPLDLAHPLAEMPSMSHGMTTGSDVLIQDLTIEQLDNHLRIVISGYDDWLIENDAAPLTRGRVQVTFGGHMGMFSVQPILWPATAIARPRARRTIPAWMTADSTYAWVGYEPLGVDIAVTEDAETGNPRKVRPVATFTTHRSTSERPLIYRVQQYTAPEIYQAETDPDTIAPKRTRWHRNNDWRGGHFEVEFGDFEAATALPANARAALAIAWDTGGAPPTPTTRMIGYLDGSHREYSGDFFGKARPTLRANDHPAAKLSNLKFMRDMPSLEMREAGELFAWLLSTVGVAESMITVDAAIGEGYVLPRSVPPWEPNFGYADDYGFIQAMDAIFTEYFGLQWGWNESGYFLRPRPEYSAPADWTLDYDTADTQAIVSVLRVEQAFSEMRNYVMVKSPAGSAIWADVDSHVEPTADNYVGDDRWDISSGADSLVQAGVMAYKRALRLREFSLVITIECERLDLEPDKFVKVDSHPDPDIPDNSIFRIIDEDGESEDMDCTVTYTAGIEEYGS